MASVVLPAGDVRRPDYRGLESVFEYTNYDGLDPRRCCGQAAAATFLTHHGRLEPKPEKAGEVMALFEKDFGPDQVAGLFGTGRKQVENLCAAYGVPLQEVEGTEELCAHLARGNPVLVMLGLSAGKFLGIVDLPGGHWMVAYGYDAERVYLTNYGHLSWAEFHDYWDNLVPRLINMKEKGLVAVTPA